MYPLDILLYELLCAELATAGACVPYLSCSGRSFDGEGWTFHSQQLLKLLAGDCLRCLTALVLYAGAVVVLALSLSLTIPQMTGAIFNLTIEIAAGHLVAIE